MHHCFHYITSIRSECIIRSFGPMACELNLLYSSIYEYLKNTHKSYSIFWMSTHVIVVFKNIWYSVIHYILNMIIISIYILNTNMHWHYLTHHAVPNYKHMHYWTALYYVYVESSVIIGNYILVYHWVSSNHNSLCIFFNVIVNHDALL